jgi:hypothetical protein
VVGRAFHAPRRSDPHGIPTISRSTETKDAMQQAVRDGLIAFKAATALAQAQATKRARHRACQGGYLPLQKPSYACAFREDMLNLEVIEDRPWASLIL